MKTTAVICEYNPFHKGHELQIDSIKRNGGNVVCIMSGGFVQRGEAALFNKYDRAKAAILAGADLVLELPYPYSCSSAEFFALGGVSVADSLGIVDELCFGSECGNLTLLEKVCNRLDSKEFILALKAARVDKSNKEKPYAVLREEIYGELFGEELPTLPNDILGIEYISALKKIKSSITPVTYKREKGYSATKSRELITQKNDFGMIPEYASELFKNCTRFDMRYADKIIISSYRFADPKQLSAFDGMTNGIAERMVRGANANGSLDGFIESIKGKSHTNAKIRRCIINGIVGVSTDMLKERPRYTQVLACSKDGRKLLKQIQKAGDIAVLTKPAHYKKMDEQAQKQHQLSNKADKLLTLMCEKPLPSDYFIKQKPFIEK